MPATTQPPAKDKRRPDLSDALSDSSGFYDGTPGVYTGIPEEDYHSHEAVDGFASSTVLKELLTSPAHARAQMDEKHDPSRAQEFGTALHSRLLTPSQFRACYATKERCSAETSSGDRCKNSGKHPFTDTDTGEIRWFCGTHKPDVEPTDTDEGSEEATATEAQRSNERERSLKPTDVDVLTESQMETLEAMEESALENPAAKTLLRDLQGESEVTILWTDDATGTDCKARIDRIIQHPRLGTAAVDLKTTRSAEPGTTPGTFGHDAAKYGYHQQAAFYLDALAAAGLPTSTFFFVPIEKKPPYAAVAYKMPQRDLEAGRSQMRQALSRFASCQKRGDWPAYADAVVDLELPSWIHDRS